MHRFSSLTMKVFRPSNPAEALVPRSLRPPDTVSFRSILRRTAVLLSGVALLPFAGCVRTRTVDKTVLAPNVQQATLDDLLKKMAAEDAAVKGLQLRVGITATKGGARQGEEKDYPTFPGIILLRKPFDLHMLMQVPVTGLRAVDMVADGKTFKLLITVPNCKMMIGSEQVSRPSANPLENLRPPVIRDALSIPPVGPEDYVSLTQNSRVLETARGNKAAVEEPDYDISVLRRKAGGDDPHVLERVRVIHISRVTLLPYEQDLYDEKGRISQIIKYDKYQTFGQADYPMSIFIDRPLDEYKLRIDINKLTLNPALDDPDTFTLATPEGCPVTQM